VATSHIRRLLTCADAGTLRLMGLLSLSKRDSCPWLRSAFPPSLRCERRILKHHCLAVNAHIEQPCAAVAAPHELMQPHVLPACAQHCLPLCWALPVKCAPCNLPAQVQEMLDGGDLPPAASGDEYDDNDLGDYLDELDDDGDGGDSAAAGGHGGGAPPDADDVAKYLGDLDVGEEPAAKRD
jgi:hypothetical protein